MSNASLTQLLRQLRPAFRGGTGSGLSDSELLQRWCQTRDEAAFEVLVWRHGPLVVATCRRLLSTEADVEDAFQATFLALVRKASAIRRHESVASWLYRVAYRVAVRARARRLPVGPVPERAIPPDDTLLWRDLRPVLDEEVSRLPQRYRGPFVLCYLQGKTNEEAARELGRPVGTILSRLSWARQRLRQRLARRGVALSMAAVAAGLAAEASAVVPRRLVGAALHGATGGASPRALELATSALQGMALARLSFLLPALVTIGALTAGIVLCRPGSPALPAKASAEATSSKPVVSKQGREPGLPKGWLRGGAPSEAYEVGLDSRVVKQGQASAYLHWQGKAESEFGTLCQSCQASPYRGKRLRLTAQVRTKDAAGGVSLWMRIDGKGTTLALDNMEGRRLQGDGSWTTQAIVLDVVEEATVLSFGLLLVGEGQAWIDDCKLEVVGREIQPTAGPVDLPHEGGEEAGLPDRAVNLGFEEGLGSEAKEEPLTREEAAWLRQAIIPLETTEPGSDDDDLKKLRKIMGGARIVSLGDGTHGSHELLRMKHRLTEYLATEAGFNIVAIEANMPETYPLNQYVQGGDGNPRQVLQSLSFCTWNTQEVLDLIEWMRRFNSSGKGRIELLGFDMQLGATAMDNVKGLIRRVEPDYRHRLERAYAGLGDCWSNPQSARRAWQQTRQEKEEMARRAGEVVEHLEASRSRYLQLEEGEVVDRAIQDARIVAQAAQLRYRPGPFRSECMAANVRWILDHARAGSKVVVWAHSGQAARRPGALGSYLDRHYGKEMVVVGLTCHEGTYTAMKPGKGIVRDNRLQPSTPGSVEWELFQTGYPRGLVDLRSVASSPHGKWLSRPLRFRMIGPLAREQQLFPTTLDQQYDALLFVDQSTGAHCFRPLSEMK